MRGFEKNPELGAIFERWGEAVSVKEARRARRAQGLAHRPSSAPYYRRPSEIAAAMAATKRRVPDPDLPEHDSPPIAPTDEERQRRLDEFAARELRKPQVSVVQLRFEF